MTDFDRIYNRRIPGDLKYEAQKGNEDVIPMWIADMDFRVPPSVVKALRSTANRGIFGYFRPDEEYDRLVCAWFERRFSWVIQPEWILKTPGVMFAVSAALSALTERGDSVLIFEPVYYPFSKIIRENSRRLVVSDLISKDGRYEIDFDDFEKKIRENKVKAVLFCSPHNPVSRVWDKNELERFSEICQKHGVFIISDEIHCDFVYSGKRHIPLALVSPKTAEITVTCTAPTKTFNLASLQASNIIISNPSLFRRVRAAVLATGYSNINAMAIAATKAAYRDADTWLSSLIGYLEESVRMLDAAFPTDGNIKLTPVEGTYLAWLDCRNLGLSDSELDALFLNRARVRLHRGVTFGKAGSGFMRMNFACPHSVLKTAVDRIKSVT